MRLLSLSAILLLAACSSPEEAGEPAPKPSGEKIGCAIGDEGDFASECILERREADIVIHHPDGSFRRFALDPAGGGLVAADGADGSAQSIEGDFLVLSVDGDRYRVPFRPMGGEGG